MCGNYAPAIPSLGSASLNIETMYLVFKQRAWAPSSTSKIKKTTNPSKPRVNWFVPNYSHKPPRWSGQLGDRSPRAHWPSALAPARPSFQQVPLSRRATAGQDQTGPLCVAVLSQRTLGNLFPGVHSISLLFMKGAFGLLSLCLGSSANKGAILLR